MCHFVLPHSSFRDSTYTDEMPEGDSDPNGIDQIFEGRAFVSLCFRLTFRVADFNFKRNKANE